MPWIDIVAPAILFSQLSKRLRVGPTTIDADLRGWFSRKQFQSESIRFSFLAIGLVLVKALVKQRAVFGHVSAGEVS